MVPYYHYAFLLPFLNSVYVFCMVKPGGKVPSWMYRACTITLSRSPKYASIVFTSITWDEKGSNVSTFWVYITKLFRLVSSPFSWVSLTYTGTILLMAKRCAALAFAHGIAKTSTSISLITFTTHLIVGVPRMTGTVTAKLEKSGMIRAI